MAGAKLGEVRVLLVVAGATARFTAHTLTATLLLQLLPALVRDVTSTLERVRSREEHLSGRPL
ncbi:hypothetical protein [Rathayibacter sp. AY1C5]|uniref:hypothetical protein n=1 Tax=Rathayibacter sp. AY1C5 TaxID=2080538 RepID=UPI000CE731E0|nr:hypothetical protein [Rathayibacter sp. AY1C5]PPG61627.1 hypothetical protein C5C57_00935 [Rathayibacter sp. AY1C5]